MKCTISVTNPGDFAAINGVYGPCFGAVPPARANVEVAALPRGARRDRVPRRPALTERGSAATTG